MSVAGVSDVAIAVRDKLRGKISQVKVKRYWPGKAPDWAEASEDQQDGELEGQATGGTIVDSREDSRLRRLQESKRDREEAIRYHREIREAEIVTTERDKKQLDEDINNEREVEESEEEDEDAIEERRRQIRERLLEREGATDGEEVFQEEEEEENDEDDSEYETESDEEENFVTMIKPMFVPKAERDTIAEREKLEREEQEIQEALQKKLEARKAETKQLVVEEIRKEEELEKAKVEGEARMSDVETDDDINEAEEYESWKMRELARIKKDKDEREAAVKEREEIEKLRSMTEEERKEWERKNPKENKATVPKQKWKFMQKYYHKGAFFQEAPDDTRGTAGTDQILKRDYSAPTGEDKFDKSILPKVMQVKHFGRSGRTKWTHLTNEDTTQFDTP